MKYLLLLVTSLYCQTVYVYEGSVYQRDTLKAHEVDVGTKVRYVIEVTDSTSFIVEGALMKPGNTSEVVQDLSYDAQFHNRLNAWVFAFSGNWKDEFTEFKGIESNRFGQYYRFKIRLVEVYEKEITGVNTYIPVVDIKKYFIEYDLLGRLK